MSLISSLSVLATAAPAGAAPPPPPGPGMDMIYILVILAVFFWLLILRPQNKERRAREQALATMKKGEKIVTAGGIHGVVTDVSQKDTVEVEIAKNVRIKLNRSSLSVIGDPKPAATDTKSARKSEEAVEKDAAPKADTGAAAVGVSTESNAAVQKKAKK